MIYPLYRYVLITPSRNEEKYIKTTIEAVINQTILPVAWIIVNDGSTDQTEKIARKYENEFNFIKVISLDNKRQRNFVSKVEAFNAGYAELSDKVFNFIGNLDADISFSESYFENILTKFNENPHLGLAGGIIVESIGRNFIKQNISLNSVAGAVQLFRKECFEEIGGYIPLQYGGIDAAAEIMARMKDWRVCTFLDFVVYHHRRVSKGQRSIIRARFRQGIMFNLLGYHPIFYLFSSLRRIFDKPVLIGSVVKIIGFLWSFLLKTKRPVTNEFISYLRTEQMRRFSAHFMCFVESIKKFHPKFN
jgi:glycosyltransferase involved in cell wall biosynthesis